MNSHSQVSVDSTGIPSSRHGLPETDDSFSLWLNCADRYVQRLQLNNVDSESTFGRVLDNGLSMVEANQKEKPRLFFPNSRSPLRSSERFISVQKWEGRVLEVSEGEFIARLVDQSQGGEDEEATISLRSVSKDDRDLVVPGGVFYWNIGEQTDMTGRQHTVSELRFRRLPPFSEDDIDKAKLGGKQIHDWIAGPSGKIAFPTTSSRRD